MGIFRHDVGRFIFILLLSLVVIVGLHGDGQAADDFTKGFEEVSTQGAESGIKVFFDIPDFILGVLKVVTGLIAIVALAAVLYGGFLYIASLGDEKKTEQAKKILLYAIIGLIILGAAGIVVNIVIGIIGGDVGGGA